LALLREAEHPRAFLDEALAQALPRLQPLDRGLCQELVYGVTRWRATLDWLIDRKTRGRPQKSGVQQLLRLGLYQLLWLDRIPDHAAVFVTVELARQAGFGPQAGFVNAVLRAAAREREALRAELERLKTSHPALGWSHPDWIYGRWRQRWGDAIAGKLLAWDNQAAEIYARVNTLRTDPARLLERWRMEENLDYDFFRGDWVAENLVFRIAPQRPVTDYGSFREGWFYVQDPSTLLAVELLEPKPGESILDLCAAPGGKTTLIAQRLENQGRVVATDRQARRLDLVRENCRRLGVSNVEVRALSDLITGGAAVFDRVLVDAPCSNTGVLRRRVEARWRLKEADPERFQADQGALLHQAATWVRPGGRLVYSTCSLEPEENEAVVQAFLQSHPGFRGLRERALTPFRDAVDGAYAASLESA
jgi:16S rRNA (cytosine967-C5)-methyltransferase